MLDRDRIALDAIHTGDTMTQRPLGPFDMPMEREPGALYHDRRCDEGKIWEEKRAMEQEEERAATAPRPAVGETPTPPRMTESGISEKARTLIDELVSSHHELAQHPTEYLPVQHVESDDEALCAYIATLESLVPEVSGSPSHIVVSAKDWDAACSVGEAAMRIVDWVYSPSGSKNGLLEAIAKGSGVTANNIVALAETLGAKRGQWNENPSWLSPSTDTPTQEK